MKSLKKTITILLLFALVLLLGALAMNYLMIKPVIDMLGESQYFVAQIENIAVYLRSLTILVAIIFLISAVVIGLLYETAVIGYDFFMKGFKLIYQYDYDVSKLPKKKLFFQEGRDIRKLVENTIKMGAIIEKIKRDSSVETTLEGIIDSIFPEIDQVLSIERIGVAFVNYHDRSIMAEYGVIKYQDIMLEPGIEVGFKETSLTEIIESRESRIYQDLGEEIRTRPVSKALKLVYDEGIRSNMTIPLIMDNVVIGYMFFSSKEIGHFDEKSLQFANTVAHEISSIINKTYLNQKVFSSATQTFADIVEKKDVETGDHIQRMSIYATIIASRLLDHKDPAYRVNKVFLNELRTHAPIHDIGKVGIPDAILKKPGRLDKEEWEIMKTHASIGAEVLEKLKDSLRIFNKNYFGMAIEIAKYHHERWDGKGYPEGLLGQEIPLSARIIAVADVFDALTSKRAYKAAYGFDESVNMIDEESGTHFDPEIVRCFHESIGEIRKVYEMDWEDNYQFVVQE